MVVEVGKLQTRVALAEKGIQYIYKEENLDHKSPLLLSSNPLHQKIPVLIHNKRPICESLIIVQYIDETWRGTTPLMPGDPHERANSMFWADFIDKKVYESGSRIWRSRGDAQRIASKDFIECLKLLERVLGDKPYFGGDSFGLVDVALIPFAFSWFYTYETFGDFIVEETCSQLMAWVQRCMAWVQRLLFIPVGIISAIEFEKSGKYLAAGDNAGHIVFFEQTYEKCVMNHPRKVLEQSDSGPITHPEFRYKTEF